MSTTNKKSGTQVCMYGPGIVFTVDEVSKKPAVDAATVQKVDKILDAVEKMAGGSQSREKTLEDAIREITAAYEKDMQRQSGGMDLEAPQVDYAAMNPHRRDNGLKCSERPHIRKDGRFGYENSEDRATVPASAFEKACAESESAYASRNPHKGKESRATEARDSARRPMSIYEEVEAAYAARNPHKNK